MRENCDFRYLVPLTVSILSLGVQAVAMLFFLIGSSGLSGESYSCVSAVMHLVRIFSINPAASFLYVMGFSLAIFYFLFLGLMIKNLIVSIRIFRTLKESRFSLYDRRYNTVRFSKLMYECLFTFELYSLHVLLTGFVGGVMNVPLGAILCVLAGAVFVGRGVALYVFQFGVPERGAILFDCLKDGVEFAGICLLFLRLQRPIFRTFSVAFFTLLNGNLLGSDASVSSFLGGFYRGAIFPFCYFIELFFCFLFLHEFLPHGIRKNDIKPRIKKALVFACVFAAVDLALTLAFAGGFSFYLLADWLALQSRTYLPMIVILSVLMGLESFYRPARYIS